MRTVLRLHPRLAPVKVAVLPLIGKDEGMTGKARPLYEELRRAMPAEYDDSASIGKRYRRQDEIGTPWALTIDQQTLEDDTITIRDRDSLAQERIPIGGARQLLQERLLAPWAPRGPDRGLARARDRERGAPRATRSATRRRGRSSSGRRRPTTPSRRGAIPSIYVLQGLTGQARAWFNVSPFARSLPGRRRGGRDRGRGRARRRVHRRRRLAVHRLARDRALRHVPHRGGRAVRRRAVPHAARGGAPRGVGEVVGRLRGDGLGHAPARPLRRVRDARRRRAVRGLAGAATSRPPPRRSRNDYDGSFDAFWEDFRSGRPVLSNADRPRAARGLGVCRGVLREPGRLRRAAVPARHRRARPRGVGALARVGPGADGARSTARRCAPRAGSGSTRAATTSTSSTSARWRSARRSRTPAWRTTGCASSSSRERTGP